MTDTLNDTEQQTDTQDDQQPTPKKLSVHDFASKIKAKYPDYNSIDDSVLVQKMVNKYPVYKDQIDFVNSTTTPQQNVPNNTTQSPSVSNTQPQNIFEGQNPIDLAKQSNDLSSKTITAPIVPDPSGLVNVGGNQTPDTNSIKQSQTIDKYLGDNKYNVRLLKEAAAMPDEYYNALGVNKDQLVQNIQTNPVKSEQLISAAKWQIPVQQNILKTQGQNGLIDFQNARNTFDSPDVDFATKRRLAPMLLSTIRANTDGSQMDKAQENFATDAANAYGSVKDNDPTLINDQKQYPNLNVNQVRALDYLKDVAPKQAQGYMAALIDPNLLKNNYDAQEAQEEKLKRLEEIGLTLKENNIKTQFDPLKKRYDELFNKNKNEGLSPDEKQEYAQITSVGAPLNDELTDIQNQRDDLSTKYRKAGANDADIMAQELLGQKNTGLNWLALETGKATSNAANGIWDLVSEPFRSDVNSKIHQLSTIGDFNQDEAITNISQKNKIDQTATGNISPELKDYVDELKNDKSLTDDQKSQALAKRLREDPSKWQMTPIEGGKSNVGITSLLYGTGQLAANLAPYVLAETMTGGGASASAIRKFTSSAASAFATGFHEDYASRAANGDPNPFYNAAISTGVNSFAMAGAQTPEELRGLAEKSNTAIGDLVSKLSDKEVLQALRNEPKSMSIFRKSLGIANNIGNSTLDASKDAIKSAAKITPFLTGGNIVNDAMNNDLKSPQDYMKQAALSGLNFAILGTGLGLAGKVGTEPNEINKAAMYQAGADPKSFLDAVNQKEQNGTISPQDAQQIKDNINKASNVFNQVPFVDAKGQPLSEKGRRNLLFLKMQENDLHDNMSKDLPKSLLDKMQDRLGNVQDKIDKVYNGTLIDEPAKRQSNKLTPEAEYYLKSVAQGNLPKTMTDNLATIASDNGIPTPKGTTVKDVIDALKVKSENQLLNDEKNKKAEVPIPETKASPTDKGVSEVIQQTEENIPSKVEGDNENKQLQKVSDSIENILGLSKEDADIVSIIHSADLTPTEKNIIFRQYKKGIMNLQDVKNYAGVLDVDKLNSDDIGKWARAALEKAKSKNRKVNAEDIDFEDLPNKPKEPITEQTVGKEQDLEQPTDVSKTNENVNAKKEKLKADYAKRVERRLKDAAEETDPNKKALLLHDALTKANKVGLDNAKEIETQLNNHLAEHGLKIELPEIGSKFNETNTGVDASIAGTSAEDLVITEVLQPGVRKISEDGKSSVIVKKPKVVVMNKAEFEKIKEQDKPQSIPDKVQEQLPTEIKRLQDQKQKELDNLLEDVNNLRGANTIEEAQSAILKATQQTSLPKAIDNAGMIIGKSVHAQAVSNLIGVARELADSIEKIQKPQVDKVNNRYDKEFSELEKNNQNENGKLPTIKEKEPLVKDNSVVENKKVENNQPQNTAIEDKGNEKQSQSESQESNEKNNENIKQKGSADSEQKNKARQKRISKSLNVDEETAKKINEIAANAKDYEDFKNQVDKLIGDNSVSENKHAEIYDNARDESKSDYETELEKNLEDLRERRSQVTSSERGAKKIEKGSPKNVSGFIRRLLHGTTLQDVEANKAKLVDQIRQYKKEKADLRAGLPKERGANFIVEKLSRAARNGDISQESADLAIDLVRKRPDLFGDVALSITKGNGSDTQGWYRAADALVKIFKNGKDDTTSVHELLHHTERFLPDEIRTKIIKEWNKEVNLQIADIQKILKTETDVDKRQQLTQGLLYLGLAQERQAEPNYVNAEAMERIMSKYLGDHTDSQGNFHKGLGQSWYQLFNPSEWWAVNASRMLKEAANKPELKTWYDKVKAFYNNLLQSVKKVFKNPYAGIEKGLDAVLNGKTLEDREGVMLSQSRRLENIKQKGSLEDRLKSIYDEVNKDKNKTEEPKENIPIEENKTELPNEKQNQGNGNVPPIEPPKENKTENNSGSESITGIRNSIVDKEREKRGMPSANKAARKEFGETWDNAMKKLDENPNASDELIQELKNKPRALSDEENALLLHKQIELQNAYDKVNNNINEAADKKDEGEVKTQRLRLAALSDALQDVYNVGKAAGTEQGRGLNTRKMLAKEDYTLASMETQKRAANNGRPLTDDERTHLTGLSNRISDLEKKIEEHQKKISDLQEDAKNNRKKQVEEGLAKDVKKGKLTIDKEKIKKDINKNIEDIKRKLKEQRSRLSANPIPVELIPDIAKLVKNYARLGINKIEEIVSNIHDALKDEFGDELTPDHVWEAIEAGTSQAKLDAYKKSLRRTNENLETKVANAKKGIFPKGREASPTDKQVENLIIQRKRLQGQFKEELEKDRLKNRTKLEKGLASFVQWERAFKLTSPITLAKLTMAAIYRVTSTPIEEAVGGVVTKILPKGITKNAYSEAGFNAKAEAVAITKMFTQGMKDAAATLAIKKGGKSDLEVLHGKQGSLPPEVADFFGHLHGALKAPIKRAAFERSMVKQNANMIKAGIDVSDPLVQVSIAMKAYQDARRSIFMQDNKAADWWQRHMVGHPTDATGTLRSSVAQFLVPFVKIPTNIVGETFTYSTGVAQGAAKLAHAMNKGMENVTPEEKDAIVRCFKKGLVGAGFLLIGYYNPNAIGGYYTGKRNPDDVGVGGIKIFGKEMPNWLLHNPLMEQLQIGATVRRVADSYIGNSEEKQGLATGIGEALLGVTKEVPFVNEAGQLNKLVGSKYDREDFVDEMAKNTLEPALLQSIAKYTDSPDAKRRPENLIEHIKMGIPGLREQVSEKRSYSKDDLKDPAFRYFTDKDMALPYTSERSISITNEKTGETKKLSDYSNDMRDKYYDTRKQILKNELRKIEKTGYVYVDKAGRVSINYADGKTRQRIDMLSRSGLAQVLSIASRKAATDTKKKVFPETEKQW